MTLWKRCLSHHLLWTFNAKLCAASSIRGTPPQWHTMLEKLEPNVLSTVGLDDLPVLLWPSGHGPCYAASAFNSRCCCCALFRTRDAWIHLVLRDDRDEAEQLSRNLCKACICGFLTASGDVLHFQIFQLIDTIWYTNIGAFFDLHFYTLTFYTYHSRLLNISCTCPRTFPCSPSTWQRTSAVRIKLPRRHSRRRKATQGDMDGRHVDKHRPHQPHSPSFRLDKMFSTHQILQARAFHLAAHLQQRNMVKHSTLC